MFYTDKAIIVEGKYDKIRLSSFIDGVIITTDGFDIYKNKEKQRLIKFYAERSGIIILTDSDRAGFQIRSFIKSFVDSDRITNVYTPDIFGKEKRKDKPSKEGKLGVEGISNEILENALRRCGAFCEKKTADDITVCDLYDIGLIGAKDSSLKRQSLLKALDLSVHVSTKALLEILNRTFEKDELFEFLESTFNI